MEKKLTQTAKEIPLEYLPDKLREMAGLIGVENTIKIAKRFGGLPLYMPKADTIIVAIRNGLIREECTGENQKELALKYKLSLRMIQEIVKQNGK